MKMIAVVNQSTLINDDEAYKMALACDFQVRHHAAPAYGVVPPVVRYLKSASEAPPGSWVLGIFDDADQAGDLGWHTEGPDGQVYGRVFVRPVLNNGGGILMSELSVCSVLSHEVLESFGDPHCNLWADTGRGTCYAYELADPVESDSYMVSVGSVMATVSDFVLPAWFDPQAPSGPFDFMGLLKAPCEVRRTGYVIAMTSGTVSDVWGEKYPQWRKATKLSDSSRTARRDKQGSA